VLSYEPDPSRRPSGENVTDVCYGQGKNKIETSR
jgi:hypothetical protein